MKSFRIITRSGIELDHVREDAKIHDENNSFNEEMKVKHNTRPVRIIENENTVKALGEFEIHTAKKRKFFQCYVVMGAIRQNAILTQNKKLPGFRVCDIKFGSEVNEIMDQPIASYFPQFSVINSPYPESYKEEADEEYGYQQAWVDHAEAIAGKIYPEVKWQLPEIRYRDKFGTDLKSDDPHFHYLGHLNAREYLGMAKNSVISNSQYFRVHNKNVISPQVFWLAPIQYAFENIGYKLVGNVPNHGLFKRLLIHSDADNMVRIPRKPPGEPLNILAGQWVQKSIYGVIDSVPYRTWVKEIQFTPNNPGEHVLRYDMYMNTSNFYGVQVYKDGQIIANHSSLYQGDYEGTLTFTIDEPAEGEPLPTLTFLYHSFDRFIPDPYEIGWYQDLEELDFYDMHPTVDFSRYIPDWTVAGYLNKSQRLFNLKIDIDDIEKTIALNFNVEDYLLGGKIVPIFKSLYIKEPKNVEAESFYLKYANNQDMGQFVSLHADVKKDENTKEIETAFKYIPYERQRHELSQVVEDREGVGLMIYDPALHPGTAENFEGQNLSIPGKGGIYQTFHKPWIMFRLNAGNVTLEGPFSKTELYQISKYKKILVDGQVYLVKAIDYTENAIALFETELEVASVSF